MAPELDLLRRFHRAGDAGAMEALVARTRPRLVRVAARITTGGDVDDAVQGAYHALLRKGDLPDGSDVMAWLITTTVRIAYRRKAFAMRHRSAAERLALPARDEPPGRALEMRERDHAVRRAVHELPDRYRDAIVLHHLSDLSVSEVAQLLQVPASTVKTRLQRGRRLLHSRLSPTLLHVAFVPLWGFADGARGVGALWKGGLLVNGKLTIAGAVAIFALGLGAGTGLGVVGTLAFGPQEAADTTDVAGAPPGAYETGSESDKQAAPSVVDAPLPRPRVEPRESPPTSARAAAGRVVAGSEDDVADAPPPEVRDRLRDVLGEFRRLCLVHDLSRVKGPSAGTEPPDPTRVERFPDKRVWPHVQGWIERDPARYRVVADDLRAFDGSGDKGAYLFTRPLEDAVASTKYQSLVLEKGVAPTGKITLTSYGSVICLGEMAGDVLTESYATVIVRGDLTGKLRTTSYAQVLVEGKLSGAIKTESYADIRALGGLTGTLDLYDSAHVYLGGFVHSSDLARITAHGRAWVLVERSDLGPGEHKIEGQPQLQITVQGY